MMAKKATTQATHQAMEVFNIQQAIDGDASNQSIGDVLAKVWTERQQSLQAAVQEYSYVVGPLTTNVPKLVSIVQKTGIPEFAWDGVNTTVRGFVKYGVLAFENQRSP